MKKIIENVSVGLLVCFFAASASAQATSTLPPIPEAAVVAPARPGMADRSDAPGPVLPMPGDFSDTSEKRIKVDKAVNLSLCVTEGNVKVNGWDRDEIRVFVEDGSKFGFKVLQKSPKTSDPVWIMVTGVESKKPNAAPTECIWGGGIEIDVPVNATVNIKGQETTTSIDRVRRVNIKTIGGDINLRNISDGVTAFAGQGDITVEESAGAMILDSTTGNILVFEAGPSEIGDVFKAKSNSGSISLQVLEHRQVEVNSISGSVTYNGQILSGGSYSMSTSKGSIRMSLPVATSCKLFASYGYGTFSSEIPFKIITENITEGPIKIVVGTLGKGGDATVRVNSNNGSISIKKQ